MGVLERLRRKSGHGSTDSAGQVDVDVTGGEGEEYVDDWSGLNDPSPWDTRPRRPSGPPRPGPRGWAIKGGGRASFVQPPQQMRGTTVQVCGLWPWATGAGAPMVGVPLGRHLFTGATVCCDPINWMRHTNLISAPSAFMLADPGLGKALDLDTVVPTPSGFTTMGEIEPGDAVMGANGHPTLVLGVSDVMTDRECWELTFSDGTTVVADADHLWQTDDRRAHVAVRLRASVTRSEVGTDSQRQRVAAAVLPPSPVRVRDFTRAAGWAGSPMESNVYRWAQPLMDKESRRVDGETLRALIHERLSGLRHDRRARGHFPTDDALGQPVIRTTAQIAGSLRSSGKWNHRVAVAPALHLPERDLPVDPYYLGYWLGDGDSASTAVTTADEEVIDELTKRGFAVTDYGGYHYYVFLQPKRSGELIHRMRALDLFGNKHIPTAYLRASETQRRLLLAGLLDADGTTSPGRVVQYTSISERLARDVQHLACTLGLRATLRSRKVTFNGKDCGLAWNVTFTTPDRVFLLGRKHLTHQTRTVGDGTRTRHRAIVAARRVPSRPVRCIKVAASDGLFLITKACIPTHNSKTVARMMLGLAGQGTVPMVLGDLRPDYVELITELGGQVIRLGPGRSVLNVLDPGETRAAVAALRQGAASAQRAADARAARGEHDLAEGLRQRAEYRAKKANELEADAADRQVTMLTALVTINRGEKPITDGERVILERALALLAAARGPEDPAPVLVDVYDVIEAAPPELQLLTVNRGDTQRYQESTHDLLTSLQALINSELGRMLGGQTTEPIDLDAHPGGVVFDVSAISDINNKMQGAALMACWSAGFATINASWALSDAGLGPRRYFFAVLDELHRALRAGAGMVDRVDLLTRLNRRDGAGYVMVTHTMSDLQSMRDAEDVAKARGLIERSKILLIGGLSEREIAGSEGSGGHPGLSSVVRFTDAEQDLVTGWSTPTSWSTSSNQSAPPPGRGKFLIKVGQRPGIPIEVLITRTEQRISDTNARWQPDTQLEDRLDEALSEDESEWS